MPAPYTVKPEEIKIMEEAAARLARIAIRQLLLMGEPAFDYAQDDQLGSSLRVKVTILHQGEMQRYIRNVQDGTIIPLKS